MATAAPTVSDLVLERSVEQLEQYRELVRKTAAGWSLSEDEGTEVSRLLALLELPSYVFPRDVDATRRMWAADSEHRERELVWVYPHLFADRRQWAELRRAERGQRRRILAELRTATARE